MATESKSTESVYGVIRRQLLDGKFTPEKKINQNLLAQELNVSRTPVIKALHMLEADGLVDNIPQRGFYMHVPTLTEIIELFALRQSLEMVSAMHMAEFGTDEQFADIESIFAGFNDTEEIDVKKYLAADKAFHKRIFEMCDNGIMHRLDQSMQIFDRSFMVGLLRPPHETLREHLEIVNALRMRDPIKAQDVSRAHTEYTKKHLMDLAKTIRSLGLDTIKISDIESLKIDIFRHRLG